MVSTILECRITKLIAVGDAYAHSDEGALCELLIKPHYITHIA